MRARRNHIRIVLAAALILAALAVFIIMRVRRPAHSEPQVQTGTLEQFPAFPSAFITPRTISVWLPDGYEAGQPCNVIYMHDGQMLFDAEATWNHQEWAVDEVAGRMIAQHQIPPCIVVGIDNTSDRLTEYFPEKTKHYIDAGKPLEIISFQGDAYLRFIVEELKPFIDERYHPATDRAHTFMIGSSMGGLISLYALCEYPDIWGGVACLSSHLSMAHLQFGKGSERMAGAFAAYVADHLPPANSCRVYMDHGTKGFDAAYGRYQPAIDAIFQRQGWDQAHYRSLVFEGDEHNEICWANRLAEPLSFLMAP